MYKRHKNKTPKTFSKLIKKSIQKYTTKLSENCFNLNPIQDGIQFFLCNFSKYKNQLPKLSDFQLQPFFHICVNFQGHTQCQCQITEPKLRAPLRKLFFFGQIPITLRLCYVFNFSHRNARVTKLWSNDHIYNII